MVVKNPPSINEIGNNYNAGKNKVIGKINNYLSELPPSINKESLSSLVQGIRGKNFRVGENRNEWLLAEAKKILSLAHNLWIEEDKKQNFIRGFRLGAASEKNLVEGVKSLAEMEDDDILVYRKISNNGQHELNVVDGVKIWSYG